MYGVSNGVNYRRLSRNSSRMDDFKIRGKENFEEYYLTNSLFYS